MWMENCWVHPNLASKHVEHLHRIQYVHMVSATVPRYRTCIFIFVLTGWIAQCPHSMYYSVTGSVDDHFAKSLGDSTWSQIKAKSDPVPFDMFTGSVDDHFAKALGDTWLRIKAEKETDPSSSTCSSQPASPRQHPSIISTWNVCANEDMNKSMTNEGDQISAEKINTLIMSVQM